MVFSVGNFVPISFGQTKGLSRPQSDGTRESQSPLSEDSVQINGVSSDDGAVVIFDPIVSVELSLSSLSMNPRLASLLTYESNNVNLADLSVEAFVGLDEFEQSYAVDSANGDIVLPASGSSFLMPKSVAQRDEAREYLYQEAEKNGFSRSQVMSMSPSELMQLSSAIVGSRIDYDRESYDRYLAGNFNGHLEQDDMGLIAMLESGKGVCRNYVDAVATTFLLFGEENANSNNVGLRKISVRATKVNHAVLALYYLKGSQDNQTAVVSIVDPTLADNQGNRFLSFPSSTLHFAPEFSASQLAAKYHNNEIDLNDIIFIVNSIDDASLRNEFLSVLQKNHNISFNLDVLADLIENSSIADLIGIARILQNFDSKLVNDFLSGKLQEFGPANFGKSSAYRFIQNNIR